jgi:hypothetical protein
MKPNVNTLERAFELARTGEFDSIAQIGAPLNKEGYSTGLVIGKYLSAQLRERCAARTRSLTGSAAQNCLGGGRGPNG